MTVQPTPTPPADRFAATPPGGRSGGAAPPPGPGAPVDHRRTPRMLSLLGGASLVAAPPLLLGGILTSPPQADPSPQAYIASLHADPALTALSAALFHYSWVTLAFGVLAAIGLVRGLRGRALTAAGGVLAGFGAVQMSGMLMLDTFTGALGVLPPDQGASIFLTAVGDPWSAFWLRSGEAGIVVGIVLLLVGLARAGVLPWWTLALLVVGVAGSVLLPAVSGAAGVASGVVAMVPLLVVGARLIVRASPSVEAAGRS